MGFLDVSAIGSTTLAAYGAAVVAVWFLVSSFTSWRRLSHIPGPFLASVSSSWIGFHLYRGQIAQAMMGLQKYGRLVRIAPNYLVTDDPEILRHVAAARGSYKRDEWWSGLRLAGDDDNLASTLETEPHDKLKAKMAAAYAGRDNMDMEGKVESQIAHLKQVIRQRHLSTGDELKAADWSKLAYYFTLDVITLLSHGKPFGFLDFDGDLYDYTDSLDRFTHVGGLIMELPWARGLLRSIWAPLFKPKFTDETGMGKVLGVTRELIESRFKGHDDGDDKSHTDMLASFMRHGVTKDKAIAESGVQLVAGAETSSTVIRYTILHLLTTPRVYQKLRKEIADAIAAGTASSPIRLEEAKRLPYLQAVIFEGIRMRPPGLYGHYKVVPAGGDTLGGIFVPGGTAVGHNSFSLMRRKDIFGQDVDIFRPERFLECSDAQRIEMDRAIDIHFGTGRWMCAGKQVAYTELYKIYFELLRDFDFQLVNPARACKEESYAIWKQTDMLVRISEVSS